MSAIEKVVGSKKEYNRMVSMLKQAELPVGLQHKDPMEAGITLEDLREFAIQFKKDSGINIEYRLGTCDHCERLHLMMIVGEEPFVVTE